MKKLCLLICACALVALALVACQNEPAEPAHSHTYADVWSSDADGHWYAATCEHAEEKANVSSHVDAENDGVCDVCNWGSDHTHTYAKEWSMDQTHHWYAATCGHSVKAELGAHEDENNDDLCDVCAQSGGCEHPITQDAWLSDADGQIGRAHV